jgi:secreted PhoX family phosphatase
VKPIQYEGDKEKVYSTAGRGEIFADVLARRFSRRGLLQGGIAASAVVISAGTIGSTAAQEASPEASPSASPAASPAAGTAPAFGSIAASAEDALVVAAGYEAIPFLKWGDPLFPDAPAFDPMNQSAEAQALQAGYNCDWIGFLPLPMGSDASDRGLLVVNHEYTNPELMFPGYLTPNPLATPGNDEIPAMVPNTTQAIVDTELEAHGLSVVEIQQSADGTWSVVLDSQYNRRITATTPMVLTGPAAGHALVKTSADATGTNVIGTLNNCAGGTTPWGTVISGEENFQQYFANLATLPEDDPVRVHHERFGLNEAESERQWERFYDRFDLSKEPNEPFRYGWGIEFDPYDPTSTPKKRTALGRAKHEGHTSVVSPSGQVVIYSGDDERFEYAYKFVTAGVYDPDDRAANLDLLDDGTLYVARFNDDGTGEWLPLTYGENGLDESNGFASQADVLINPRASGDVLGATKMDRPEDFEANPVSGRVYLVCTNNTNRGIEDNPGADAANPRVENAYGHIVELTEEGGDHAATTFGWEIFMLCGTPTDESTYFAGFPKEQVSAISSPDNITFDQAGNLWISTDGQPGTLEVNDGIYAVPTDGPERGYLKQFFSGIPGGEVSGPIFSPDNTSLFVSIQHPGEGGTFEEPVSSWPDSAGAPRPSVVVIRKLDGGPIGS